MLKRGRELIDELGTALDLCGQTSFLLTRDVLGFTVLDLALRLCEDATGGARSNTAPSRAICARGTCG